MRVFIRGDFRGVWGKTQKQISTMRKLDEVYQVTRSFAFNGIV